MEQIRSNGEQKELRDEVVDLGTRYGIVTPYTSYLALENDQTSLNVVPGQANAPVSRRLSSASGGLAAPKAADAVATTGAIAVQESKRAREQQRAYQLKEEEASSVIRRVGGKTFYLRNDVWTDAEFKADAGLPEMELKFGSDEYFAILKQKPALSSYFSLGERLVVVFERKVYRVNAGTR